MPTTANSGRFSSPRAQRRLLWGSGGVLVIGLIVFLSLVVLRGSSGVHAKLTNQPAQLALHLQKAPPAPGTFQLARKFIETAVLRKNLDSIYPYVAPTLTDGMSRAQWDKGNIPVVPYTAENAKTAAFTVDWSYKDRILLEVDLVAKPGTNTRPHLPFFLGLKKIGAKGHRHWVVNYWLPHWTQPIPKGDLGN